MKLTFLGVSGALSLKYNSNMLIEQGRDCMLFDCGEDVMHSLKAAGRKPEDLDAVFISHLHFDHMGGLSWLGYYTYFVMKKRIRLYIHESMISDLWAMLRPAMEKLDGHEMVTLDEYFNVITFTDDSPCVVGSFYFEPVRQVHVETPHGNMYSYGAIFKHSTSDGKYWKPFNSSDERIFISSDTKKLYIPLGAFPTVIFCDVDIMNLSGVHPNYDVLKEMPSAIKENMWLYHYHDFHDIGYNQPDYVKDGFAGFVKEGQVFEFGEKISDKEAVEVLTEEIYKPREALEGEAAKEADKHIAFNYGAGHPDYDTAALPASTVISENNNKEKPFSSDGLEHRRSDVEEKRKDQL